MTTFYIDFDGYCEIDAETPEEAQDKFWEILQNEQQLPNSLYCIEGVEKKCQKKLLTNKN